MSAQKLAQTRPGARGALLFYSCIPITGDWAFGPWPDGVPVQIHGMDADPIFVGEGDVDAAREIVATVDDAELFLYPGDQHYFADSSLPSYDPEATALLTRRVLELPRPGPGSPALTHLHSCRESSILDTRDRQGAAGGSGQEKRMADT